MRMEVSKEEAELILFHRKQREDAIRSAAETVIKQSNCVHDFRYDGHGHNFSYYRCYKCGIEEER